jgi:aconitate hydratase 2/2-methylisocitrate dehydratase
MMLEKYRKNAVKREKKNLPPLPLTAEETGAFIQLLEANDKSSEDLLQLIASRVEPGVSASAKVKATWLEKVALGQSSCTAVTPEKAVEMLARMGGGYNVGVLLNLLEKSILPSLCGEALKHCILIYEAFDRVTALSEKEGVPAEIAKEILQSWAAAEWFTSAMVLEEEMRFTVCKINGEINTDDMSPGSEVQSRADIPLHAQSFCVKRFPEVQGELQSIQQKGQRVAFASDVMGTGSSRKSALNSLVWLIGENIPDVPNKRVGGIVMGNIIAPIFYATARDSGTLVLECDTSKISSGDELILNFPDWTLRKKNGEKIELHPGPSTIIDEYRAKGRLNLTIGCQLTKKACAYLGCEFPAIFSEPEKPVASPGQGYTQAQKIVGRACGVEGVLPGTVCEPEMTTVGSQDSTGPMNMQEIAELACLEFKTDLFMQSFCHTAAYPKESDFARWKMLQEMTVAWGGVTFQPGDGVIHSLINRMIVPDTVGTGADSHTRFPMGLSFPAGSGLVAFAAALGFMPLEMPESVRVRFSGTRAPGITVRDMVNAIPFFAKEQGLLTVGGKEKKNVFSGAIMEVEGVEEFTAADAFELSNSSAERSAAAATLKLSLHAVVERLKENIAFLRSLLADGYQSAEAISRRIKRLEKWLESPRLLEADDNAEYLATLDVDMSRVTEPLLACPNDPDDVRLLSTVAGDKVDEVFIGSCMTFLKHLQAAEDILKRDGGYAKTGLWIAPSTRMDRDTLREHGGFALFAGAGARIETPGCSLCMGNQARVRPDSTVVSTSTRNFNNRLGDGNRVYLASSEVAAVTALLGKIPTVAEYRQKMGLE